MNEILIEVKLTVRDIYEFQKSFLFRRLTFKQCLVLYGLFAIFVAIQIVTDGLSSAATYKHLLLLFMPVLVVGILMFFVYKTSMDMIRTGKLFEKPTTYKISSTGIAYSSDSGNGQYNWADFYKLKETDHSFLFYVSKQQALIMPKADMNGDTLEGLRNLCQTTSLGLDTHKPWKLFAVGAVLMSLSIVVMLISTMALPGVSIH